MAKKKNGPEEKPCLPITNYFPIRRSKRQTTKEIEENKQKQLKELIDTGTNESLLEVFLCPVKGRSVRTLKCFQKGEFVVEYKGDIISVKSAQIREQRYANNENIGSFMYYFRHRDSVFCVDATEEAPFKGRLINHSYLKPNLKTRVADFGSDFHLVLVALRDVGVGEELLYDYGERRPCVLALNEWIMNS